MERLTVGTPSLAARAAAMLTARRTLRGPCDSATLIYIGPDVVPRAVPLAPRNNNHHHYHYKEQPPPPPPPPLPPPPLSLPFSLSSSSPPPPPLSLSSSSSSSSSSGSFFAESLMREKDTYGNEVTRLARPLPVEYLLVDVPASTPLTPQFTFFTEDNITPFPVENRQIDGQVQEFNSLCTYMQQFNSDQFLEATSDFHLLLFIATMDMYPMKDHMLPLLEAVRNKDKQKAMEWAQSEHWATVEQLISVTSTSSRPPQTSSFGNSSRTLPAAAAEASGGIGVGTEPIANPPPDQALWTCSHCTFLNAADLAVCEMCNLPRDDVEEYGEEMMRELF